MCRMLTCWIMSYFMRIINQISSSCLRLIQFTISWSGKTDDDIMENNNNNNNNNNNEMHKSDIDDDMDFEIVDSFV